jgi:hypothetical protein
MEHESLYFYQTLSNQRCTYSTPDEVGYHLPFTVGLDDLAEVVQLLDRPLTDSGAFTRVEMG